MERGVLLGAAWLRWAAWVWLAAVALANLHRVDHPSLAVAGVAATGAVTLIAHAAVMRSGWARATRPLLVGAELTVAVAVVLADGWVHQGRITGQSLAGIWPIPVILVSTVAGGLLWGIGSGVLLTAARAVSVVVGGTASGEGGRQALAVISTGVSWIAFGVVCGVVLRLLRDAQRDLADAATRERIARDLHDGVLQTLAMIERRSDSAEIARLAREQERDLRAYLFGDRDHPEGVAAALRSAAARFERAWPDCTATVSISDDLPEVGPADVDALVGAVTEALTNAAKHGRARRVFVFADIDDATSGVFVTVKDDGDGFDPATVTERVGMSRSIRERIRFAGGEASFTSSPGEGTEVAIVLPPAERAKAPK